MIDIKSYDYNKIMGRTVKFIPTACNERNKGQVAEYVQPVTGHIDYINKAHGWFRVSYQINGCALFECFKVCDIGKDVTLIGHKKDR